MGHYKIHYQVGKRQEYVYPAGIAGVVWKSVAYHGTERDMVGQTEAEIKADGTDVVALNPQEAKKLAEEYASAYPKPKGFPPFSPREYLAARTRKRR
jgi:hypothetical protein